MDEEMISESMDVIKHMREGAQGMRDIEECRSLPLLESVRIFVEVGVPVGDFLTAALSNKFVEAATGADEGNQHRLYHYAILFYNGIPAQCWGTEEKVQAWIEAHGRLRAEAAESAKGETHECNGVSGV